MGEDYGGGDDDDDPRVEWNGWKVQIVITTSRLLTKWQRYTPDFRTSCKPQQQLELRFKKEEKWRTCLNFSCRPLSIILKFSSSLSTRHDSSETTCHTNMKMKLKVSTRRSISLPGSLVVLFYSRWCLWSWLKCGKWWWWWWWWWWWFSKSISWPGWVCCGTRRGDGTTLPLASLARLALALLIRHNKAGNGRLLM